MRHNAAGVRGAYASRAFQPGDTVAAIPTSTCIKLENDGFPAEHAHELAIRIHNNASFIADYLPYFTTLPDPQASLTSELFSDALIEQLQSPRLAEIIKRERAVAEAVYFGKYADDRSPEKKYQPLPEVLKGAEGFTPVAFRWLAAMVSRLSTMS